MSTWHRRMCGTCPLTAFPAASATPVPMEIRVASSVRVVGRRSMQTASAATATGENARSTCAGAMSPSPRRRYSSDVLRGAREVWRPSTAHWPDLPRLLSALRVIYGLLGSVDLRVSLAPG